MNTVGFNSWDVARTVKLIETESRMLVARVLEEEWVENDCLMGIEFQFFKVRIPRMGGSDGSTAMWV